MRCATTDMIGTGDIYYYYQSSTHVRRGGRRQHRVYDNSGHTCTSSMYAGSTRDCSSILDRGLHKSHGRPRAKNKIARAENQLLPAYSVIRILRCIGGTFAFRTVRKTQERNLGQLIFSRPSDLKRITFFHLPPPLFIVLSKTVHNHRSNRMPGSPVVGGALTPALPPRPFLAAKQCHVGLTARPSH